MAKKELRLAVVIYGGASLAVYMHGVTKELLKLVRASKVLHEVGLEQASGYANGPDPRPCDTEAVYFDILEAINRHHHFRVVIDVVAGASAGAINGVMLAKALVDDALLDAQTEGWLQDADVERLAAEAVTPWRKWYLYPLLRALAYWLPREVAASEETRRKITRLIRSSWFRPPFSGERLCHHFFDALAALGASRRAGSSLLPPGQRLDVYASITDLLGYPRTIRLHEALVAREMEHAAFCRLAHVATEAGRAESDFRDDNLPALVWAARASSSYAGAFPPFQHDELRRVLRDRRRVWPGEQRFLEHSIRARDGSPGVRHFDPLTRHFVDGGIVNNKPFGAALEALNHRPADRQVERCLVYVEPDPNLQDAVDPKRGFGYLATIRAALSSIPRNQPILDDLNAVVAQDARVQINRRIIDANRRQIDAQVAELRGVHGWRTLSLDRVTHLRTSMAGRAEQSMGLAYQAYLQRRLWRVVGALVRGWSDLAGATEDPSLIHAMEHAIVSGWGGVGEADGSSTTPEALNGVAGGQHQRQQSFLERFDVAFRIRRLQFLIRRINRYESERGLDERSRGALDALKQTTYGFMERCYRLRRSEQVDHELIDRLVSAAGRLPLPAAEALALLDTLAGSLDLVALDREIDQAFLAHHDAIDSDSVCDALTNDYLGFPVYDVLLLTPGSLEGAPDPLTPVRVERISPADARSLSDAFTGLRCRDFMGFLGFFNRDYREHDYLWGRLNGAERVIDLLVSVAGEGVLDPVALKREVFRVIVERERRRLGRLGPELDRIAAALG